jgi:hypothetical protein
MLDLDSRVANWNCSAVTCMEECIACGFEGGV